MVILSQIVGAGGFSLVDNLRLIVIAAIFIGIVAVLLYLKFVNSGDKTNGKYISKEKASENIDDIADSAEGTGEEPVVNSSEAIDEKIKNSEAEIVTRVETVIKNLRSQADTKLAAEIEGLISKIEEREKEVVKKIESVIDTKVQEALNKISDKIGEALYTQKSSTASVLEKLVDSLRTEEVPTGSLASVKAEKDIDEISTKSRIQGSKATGSSNIEKVLKLNKTECEPDCVSGTNKLQEKKAFVSSAISEEIIENMVDFDMQESLAEGPEVQSEDKADVGLEENEQIASPEKNEENVSEGAAGDFDMQAFLDAEPVSSSSSAESNVVSEEIQEEELKEPSEDNANVELDDIVTGGMAGDSADFDIQEFLDELENLPSEKDLESEK